MPYCPECRAEYREGFTRCAECGVDLVAELPEPFDLSEENIRRALEGQELVVVIRGELDVVKEYRDLLSQHRIPALIVEDAEPPPQPGMPQRVRLVVSSEDQQATAAALGQNFQGMLAEEGLDSGGPLDYGRCPACGHQLAEEAEECPECGLFIPKG